MLRFSFGPYFVLVFRLGRCMYGSIKSAGLNQSCRSKAKFAFLSCFFREMRLALNVFVVVFLQFARFNMRAFWVEGPIRWIRGKVVDFSGSAVNHVLGLQCSTGVGVERVGVREANT